jgi:iron complex transport system substrate-binding protein
MSNTASESKMTRRIVKFCLFLFIIVSISLTSGCLNQIKNESVNQDSSVNFKQISIIDDANRHITLNKPAQRIVCMNTNEPEILVAMGLGDNVIGVPEYTTEQHDLMEKLPNARSIGGGWSNPNIEKILALNPDVVITLTATSPSVEKRLQDANITLVYMDAFVIDKIPKSIECLATITGSPPSSNRYMKFYDCYIGIVNSRLADVPIDDYPSVYIELSSPYTTAGVGSGGDSLIRLAHGRNIAGSINSTWPKVSSEWVVENNPDVIIISRSPADQGNLSNIYDDMLGRPGFSNLKAIHNNRMYVINSKITNGDQGIISLLYCVRAFYPDRFRDIDPDKVLHEYARDFVPGSDNLEPFYPSVTQFS